MKIRFVHEWRPVIRKGRVVGRQYVLAIAITIKRRVSHATRR